VNIKTFIFLAIFPLILLSCNTTRKSTGNSSPYLTEEEPEKEITVLEEKVKAIDQPDETVYRYYVIIGSFKVIENARQYRSDLSKEGFNPVILENENGLFRVSVGAYNEEKEARNRIAGIRGNYKDYSDVWLLVRK
jgi:cell division protein FtsN